MTGGSGQSGHDATLLHAGCVEWAGRGALILGPSGSGKSGLALQLMAYGCNLVSDDQTLLSRRGDVLWAKAPAALGGRIEARGIGILAAIEQPASRVQIVIDMEQDETERLPPMRVREILGLNFPLLHRCESAHFAAAVLQYLKGERVA